MTPRVPLAWLNLTHHRARLAAKLAGVAFAVVLMCMELGFWNALFDSTVALVEGLRGELFVTSSAHYALTVREPFDRRRLQQARGVPGVKAAEALYIETAFGLWKNPDPHDRIARPIRVLAFDPGADLFALPEVRRHRLGLQRPGTVLFDVRSKHDSYGPRRAGLKTELSGRQVEVLALFDMGTDFVNDGTVITSAETYRRLLRPGLSEHQALGRADLGVVQLAEGADAEAVRRALRDRLPRDVSIHTRDELIGLERKFWREATPIGAVFAIGMAVGFIVGVVICYQILYSDISDHLAEFATLKAMGYGRGYFVGVVCQQAMLLSLLGFVPGAAVSYLLYEAMRHFTGLPMALTLPRAALVLALTVAMCGVSGLLALRKVLSSDPAELFK